MTRNFPRSKAVSEQARADLSARLRDRRSEIERAVLARVYAIADPTEVDDPEYLYGLRAAVAAMIDYVLTTIERSEEYAPLIPVAVLTQTRIAARNAVDVGTVLRRCTASCSVLDAFLLEEASVDSRLSGAAIKKLMSSQLTLRDHLLAAVDEEYPREDRRPSPFSDARLAKRVQQLLDGELVDPSDLPYDFEGHHLAAVAEGDGVLEMLRDLARTLDGRPLFVPPDSETVWAWIGFRHVIDRQRLDRFVSANRATGARIGLGEPGQGLTGWRLTHQQASEAFPIARCRHRGIVRYADVALPVSMRKDDLLSTSLRELYLAPLARGRDGGTALRDTLRAYFAAGRNGASAANALKVSRQTISNHLKAVEELIDRPLATCALEVEAALRLDEVDPISQPHQPPLHADRLTPSSGTQHF